MRHWLNHMASEAVAEGQLNTQRGSVRGERLYPAKSSRTYWVLTQLREAMESIAPTIGESQADLLVDFGCGNMPYRSLFENRVGTYCGCDLPGNDLADRLITNARTLPFNDGTVDVVLSSQVLEHVEDPAAYLAEAHRVLKPLGLLILSTHGNWRYHPDPLDLWRWTSQGLKKQVEAAGFSVERFTGVLGPESSALQLWQDSVQLRVPQRFRRLFTYLVQLRIERADRRCSAAERDADASVYVVTARKRSNHS